MIEAIVTLNNRNLLYRKKDLINWSPTLHSTISDIEVENLYVTKKTQLQIPGYEKMITFGEIVHIAYPVKDSSKIYFLFSSNYIYDFYRKIYFLKT